MGYPYYQQMNYQPNYYGQPNPYYQQMQQQAIAQQQAQQQQNQQIQQPAIQQSGFVPVRSEQEARSYPVAPGNSVTFKDENAPYITGESALTAMRAVFGAIESSEKGCVVKVNG